MKEIMQLKPSHCEDNINKVYEYEHSDFFIQPKLDGERMLIHILNGKIYCTSRRISKETGKYNEFQDKLPFLYDNFTMENIQKLGYTVIDCECISKDWSTIVGILHSNKERAIELQKENQVNFIAFDVLFFCGIDMRNFTYIQRNTALEAIFLFIKPNKNIYRIPYWREYFYGQGDDTLKQCIEETYNHAIRDGYEGVVIKNMNAKYYDKNAMVKLKQFNTLDCVVCGYKKGNGKYNNLVGSLEIGYYDQETNKVVKISNVNCKTDKDRQYWTSNKENLLNTVVEIKCQQITKNSLRNPVLLRIRQDKDYKDCTYYSIFGKEKENE